MNYFSKNNFSDKTYRKRLYYDFRWNRFILGANDFIFNWPVIVKPYSDGVVPITTCLLMTTRTLLGNSSDKSCRYRHSSVFICKIHTYSLLWEMVVVVGDLSWSYPAILPNCLYRQHVRGLGVIPGYYCISKLELFVIKRS